MAGSARKAPAKKAAVKAAAQKKCNTMRTLSSHWTRLNTSVCARACTLAALAMGRIRPMVFTSY